MSTGWTESINMLLKREGTHATQETIFPKWSWSSLRKSEVKNQGFPDRHFHEKYYTLSSSVIKNSDSMVPGAALRKRNPALTVRLMPQEEKDCRSAVPHIEFSYKQ